MLLNTTLGLVSGVVSSAVQTTPQTSTQTSAESLIEETQNETEEAAASGGARLAEETKKGTSAPRTMTPGKTQESAGVRRFAEADDTVKATEADVVSARRAAIELQEQLKMSSVMSQIGGSVSDGLAQLGLGPVKSGSATPGLAIAAYAQGQTGSRAAATPLVANDRA